MDCSDIRELLELYSLTSLEGDEKAQVESHLEDCTDCQKIAMEYAMAVNALPQALAAASPLELPSHLRERVLEAVKAVETDSLTNADNKPKIMLKRPTSGVGRQLRAVGAIAAVVLLALSVGWSVRLSVALAQERALRAEYANLVGQQEIVLEVIDSNKTVKRLLRPVDSGSASYGKLYTRPDLPHVVIMAARLPMSPEGYVYRLWLTSNGNTHSTGVLAVNADGFGMIVFDSDQNGPSYEAAQIVLQPEDSISPEGTVVLLWTASG